MFYKDLVDYSQFLEPNTERVYQFKSKRLEFCRRHSHKDKMLMIVQFDGVIGEVYRRSLTDDVPQLFLRHGAAEGLRELSKHF